MKKRIYVKPELWIVAPREELMINPLKGSWRVVKSSGDQDGWFSVIEEDDWDDDFKGANDSFFDD